MLKEHPRMGSPDWVDLTFASLPVRKLKGHSKHTQYHQTYVEVMGRTMGAQGRTEAIALIALEYLTKRGLIRRFKEQPFRTTLNEFESEIVPDFLAQGPAADELFVLEMKTARFVTRLIQNQLERNRQKFEKFGLKYVVWTDKNVLTHPVRHHLIHMRRFGMHMPNEEQKNIVARVEKDGAATVKALYDSGFDIGGIYAAAWSGLIHFSITQPLVETSRIYTSPVDDLRATFLEKTRNADDWWVSLPQC